MSNLLSDTWTLAVRMLKHSVRSPDTIMTVVAMPAFLLLAFVFVLGGAMNTGAANYVDYVVPVVLLFCVASGVAYTGYRVNQDVTSGFFARLRTMPIARSALIGGHLVASVLANLVSVAVIWVVSLAIGYRPRPAVAWWWASCGILLLAVVAFSVLGVAFGVLAKTNEGAGMFSYLLMVLLFVSSGFAPTDTMPAGLRAFADHQPMTPLINALRAGQLGQPMGADAWVATVWLVGVIVVFAVVAGLAQTRATTRPS